MSSPLLIGALVVAGLFLAGLPRRRRRRRSRAPWLAGVVLLAGVAALLQGNAATLTEKLGVNTLTTRGDTVAAQPRAAAPVHLSGSVLNDAGYAKLRAGDYRGALPLLQQAVQRLHGTGSIVDAYALYNLAFARFALGQCNGVLAMLDRSQERQGYRHEIDRLRRQARKRCG